MQDRQLGEMEEGRRGGGEENGGEELMKLMKAEMEPEDGAGKEELRVSEMEITQRVGNEGG